jgi:glutathione S-transferase
VPERQLADQDFICGDYSIADMACWPWVDQYHYRVGDLAADYPAISAWRDRIAARPAVQRAMKLGTDWTPGAPPP